MKKEKPINIIFFLFLVLAQVFLTSCSHADYNRELYFQSASSEYHQTQQIPASDTEPAQYMVCGSSDNPCANTTPIGTAPGLKKITHSSKHLISFKRGQQCSLK